MFRISVGWKKMIRSLIYLKIQQTGLPDGVDGAREGFDCKSWARVFSSCLIDSSWPSW